MIGHANTLYARLILCLAITLGFAISAQAVPTLSFGISNPTPQVGDSITVDVIASDVTDLFAFNLDIGFNPAVLGIATVNAGNFLASGGGLTLSGIGLFGFDTSMPGQIQDINDSLLGPVAGVSGSGILATIGFDILAPGISQIAFLDVNALAGTEMIDSTGVPITIMNANIGTITVPEPSTPLLFLSGMLAAVFRQRHFTGLSKTNSLFQNL